MSDPVHQRVLVAGATGYLGRWVVRAFKRRGYFVRLLTRSRERLAEHGPFGSPALGPQDYDEIFVGELTQPETLAGAADGIDLVFSSVGITRQQDGLGYAQVDYQCNRNLVDEAQRAGVGRFVFVSLLCPEEIMDLAITRARERLVEDLRDSGLDYRIIRPSGYFSDMAALYRRATRGRIFLVGDGENQVNPIHGRDLAEVCVATAEGDAVEVAVGGPEILTLREAAELAFEIAGRKPKITCVSLPTANRAVKLLRLFSRHAADRAAYVTTTGECDAVAPLCGSTRLRSYFETLHQADSGGS